MSNLVCIEDIIKVVGMTNYTNSLKLNIKALEYIGYIVDNNNKAVLNFKYCDEDNAIKLIKLGIDKCSKITFNYCNCLTYNSEHLCSHISLAVEFVYTNKELITDIVSNLLDTTDTTFNKLLFKELEDDQIRTPINLEIKLKKINSYYNNISNYSLGLRVGEDQLYSLNSKLDLFLNEYTTEDFELKFGKNFTYYANKHYIKEVDKKIMDFLTIYYHGSINKYNSYFNGQIILSGELLKNFLKLLKDKNFYLETSMFPEHYSNVLTDLNLGIKISDEDNMVKVELDNLNIEAIDDDMNFVKYKTDVYELDAKSAKLLKILVKNNKKTIIFNETELNQFSKLIYPKLKKIDKLLKVTETIDSKFIDQKLTPKFYFEKDNNTIVGKILLTYKDVDINIFDKDAKIGDYFISRDSELEEEYKNELIGEGFKKRNKEFILSNEENIVNFLEVGLNDLCKKYAVFVSKEVKDQKIIKKLNIKNSFELGRDNILTYNFTMDHIDRLELSSLITAVREQKKYYRLKDGGIVSIKDTELNEFTNLIDEIGVNKGLNNINGTYHVPTYKIMTLDDTNGDFIKLSEPIKDMINNFSKYKNSPISIANEDLMLLRDYQVTGVKWMKMLSSCGFGGILADEMGLGKSIQTIEYIKLKLKEDKHRLFLIVVPTSLIYNWVNEFEKFGSEITVEIINESKVKRLKAINNIGSANVIITTYGLIRQDIREYEKIHFDTCIIDEAQNIKNVSAGNTSAVKLIKATTKFALTGTPLENSVLELWSIFDFIMPGLLNNIRIFKEKYNIKNIEADISVLDDLKLKIAPFILRRKKSDVLKDLPDKIENTVYVDLSVEQKKLYLAWLEKTKVEINDVINKNEYMRSQILILSLLTKLRQICIEPRLIDKNYNGTNAKLDSLIDILIEVIENDHKILLFSQFPSALSYVRAELIKKGITYYYLDGNTKSKTRMELVDKFNIDKTNVFLISLKAGGTGLNLTSADVVIHLDPWWNPQVENQATDRAHRIGQKKVVEVIKMIAKGTIEEKILLMQEKKKKLSDQVIEGKERSELVLSKLSAKDLKELLEM